MQRKSGKDKFALQRCSVAVRFRGIFFLKYAYIYIYTATVLTSKELSNRF